MTLKFKRLHEAAILPTRANPTDSGLDLYAIEDVVLLPGVPTLVRTGWAVELPEPREYSIECLETPAQYEANKYGSPYDVLPITFEAQIRPRSGLALKHGITVVNSPGTLDNSYRGEIGVILLWSGHAPNVYGMTNQGMVGTTRWVAINGNEPPILEGEHYAGTLAYKIRKGDRIAQLVLCPVVLCEPVEAEELSETERGHGGFGSSGR